MDKNKFEDFKINRYQDQIKYYDNQSKHNKMRYDFFQWLLIISSSVTPVLIAISFGYTEYYVLKWVVVITAVVVAISASSLRIFKFYENWISYRTTCETLKKEIYMLEAEIGEYNNSSDKEATFVQRVESIISQENTLWITTYKKEDKPDKIK